MSAVMAGSQLLGFAPGQRSATLRTTPRIRMISAADDARLEQFGNRLSQRSRYQRFFSPRGFLPGEVHRLTNIDLQREVALVATIEVAGEERLIGVARYVIDPAEHSAELAIVIADDWQHKGLGATLLARLLAIAKQHGVKVIKGVVLATNHAMQKLAMRLGFSLNRVAGDGSIVQTSKQLTLEH
jgi:acetyltransferase